MFSNGIEAGEAAANHAGIDWKESAYRTTCFLHHEKKCVVCGEDKIIDVHHYDENKNNNSTENLIPLCPTHHRYWHSRYRSLIQKKVDHYKITIQKDSL
jgi:5-methylcytosine-specific restriction endonuclease McrA